METRAGWWASKKILVGETIVLIILPLYLVGRWPILLAYRHLMMGIGLVYFGKFVLDNPQAFKTLRRSFRLPKMSVLLVVGLVCILISGLLALIFPFFKTTGGAGETVFFTKHWSVWEIIISYVLLSVPVQELLFRGLYCERLSQTGVSTKLVIGLTAVIFGFVHLPFHNKLMFWGTLVGGLWWGSLWVQSKSLWPSMLAHAVLGSVFIYLVTNG